jgi:hypothetical protein
VIYLLYALLAILVVLIVVALSEQWKDREPVKMRLATIAASGTGILFLIYAMLGYVGEPTLITLYRQDASMGASAYMAMRIVSNALNTGAIFAAGWAILLTGWAAFRDMKFPKALAVLLLVAGGFSILAFQVPIFSLLAPLLYIVWSIWLGAFLISSSSQHIQAANLASWVAEK